MNTTPFDTQQVRLDLMKELLEVEEKVINEEDVEVITELAQVIRWLKNKLQFLESPIYQERKQKANQ
jgi:hypothetical protein